MVPAISEICNVVHLSAARYDQGMIVITSDPNSKTKKQHDQIHQVSCGNAVPFVSYDFNCYFSGWACLLHSELLLKKPARFLEVVKSLIVSRPSEI